MFATVTFIACLLFGVASAFIDDLDPEKLVRDPSSIISWCAAGSAELEKCLRFQTAVSENVTAFTFGSELLANFKSLECHEAFDKSQCMTALDTGKADLVKLDPGEVYIGGRYHSLIPIAQEVDEDETARDFSYAVAVIRRESSGAFESLADLEGKTGCFPYVGSLAGWTLPMSLLLENSTIPVADCNNHVKSAIEFFGPSCAPNSLTDVFNRLGDNSDRLCEACGGSSYGGFHCTGRDPYYGFQGAFACLNSEDVVEGASPHRIAFLKHTTVNDAILALREPRLPGARPVSQKLATSTQADFMLLCPDGRKAEIHEFERCNWGSAPSDAIVTSSARTDYVLMYQEFLRVAVELFGSRERVLVQKGDQSAVVKSFRLFESEGQVKDLVFSDRTARFLPIEQVKWNYKQYLGPRILESFESVRKCPMAKLTLCVTSPAEFAKCMALRTALKAQMIQPELQCFQAVNSLDCVKAISKGQADVVMLDAGDVYTAGYDYNLIPLMVEQYNLEDPEYYAVAVAKQKDPTTDLLYLKNRNTCHGGMMTGAGWVLPLAFLLNNKRMRGYDCDSPRAASEFFSKSCAPGATNRDYNNGRTWNNLCDLCHGSTGSFCSRDASEPFFGFSGAFRCLVEGGGHVAFVRHTTVMENTDGKRRMWWARNQIAEDYQLLCRDGTRTTVKGYEDCNLGKIKGNALVGRKADRIPTRVTTDLFIYAQQFYGVKHGDLFSFKMFSSPEPSFDLIFQDSTQQLMIIEEEERDYASFLGDDFLHAMHAVNCRAGAAVLVPLAPVLVFGFVAALRFAVECSLCESGSVCVLNHKLVERQREWWKMPGRREPPLWDTQHLFDPPPPPPLLLLLLLLLRRRPGFQGRNNPFMAAHSHGRNYQPRLPPEHHHRNHNHHLSSSGQQQQQQQHVLGNTVASISESRAFPTGMLSHAWQRPLPPLSPIAAGLASSSSSAVGAAGCGGDPGSSATNKSSTASSALRKISATTQRKFSTVTDAVSRKVSTTIWGLAGGSGIVGTGYYGGGTPNLKHMEIASQSKTLASQYIRARLKRSGFFHLRKLVGLQRLRSLANIPGGILSITVTSDKVLRSVLIAIAAELFKADITWSRIVSLYAVTGGLAVDCVKQGHPEFLPALVEAVGDIMEQDLAAWIVSQGGWAGLLILYKDPENEPSMVHSLVVLIMIISREHAYMPSHWASSDLDPKEVITRHINHAVK
ncbi:unnamed protein product, partial [Notodromas monacha]